VGEYDVPPSGGSLEIGNGLGVYTQRSPLREVPPSGGSLEIGNYANAIRARGPLVSSPFGGIPRNWKLATPDPVGWTGGSSPFGGIPRNWKHAVNDQDDLTKAFVKFPLRGDP